MDDTKLCECLNNEAQIDSIIDGDSDITSEMQLESQVYSDLEKVVEVVDRYEGGTTRDIIVSVDNEADIITATLQKMWFLSVDEFPEVGSDNLIYADKGTGDLYTYNSQSGEYEKLVGDTDLRSISINGEKVEIDENKNADIPKATSTQLGVVAVDGAVADDSENPVQNKVIKKYIDGTKTALDTTIAGLDGKIGSTDGKVENLKQTLDATNKNLSDTQNSVNLAHSEIEKTNTRVTSLENRATTTETDISNINNSITTINGKIANISTSIDDKASLTEENSFEGKQNFNGEVEINATVEANRNVNINNATLNIVDEANDKVTTVYSDRIVSTSGDGGATVEAKLPSNSGTLLTDKDNVAYKDEIPDVSQFITRAVNDLINYYTKSEIDTTVIGLQAQISAIPKFAISVVTALPTTDISETTIYLLKTSTTETGNLYTEYIYINSSWESLGTQTLDLTGYAKESWVETKIANFLTTSQVNTLISSALQEYSKTGEFSDIAFSGNLSDGTQDSTHRLVSDSEKATWNAKQNALTFDETPTANSDNPVKSKGIKTELGKMVDLATAQTITGKKTYSVRPALQENGTTSEFATLSDLANYVATQSNDEDTYAQVTNEDGAVTISVAENTTNHTLRVDNTGVYVDDHQIASVDDIAKSATSLTNDYTSKIDATNSRVTTLDGAVTTNSNDIVTINNTLGDYTTSIADLNTEVEKLQDTTTTGLSNRITKNMLDIYAGNVDKCNTNSVDGICTNLYKTDGSFYTSRQFLFPDFIATSDDTTNKHTFSIDTDKFATVEDMTTTISEATSPLYSNITSLKSQIPTKVSELTNDSGYITSALLPTIVQEGGDSTTAVMSQDSTTKELEKKQDLIEYVTLPTDTTSISEEDYNKLVNHPENKIIFNGEYYDYACKTTGLSEGANYIKATTTIKSNILSGDTYNHHIVVIGVRKGLVDSPYYTIVKDTQLAEYDTYLDFAQSEYKKTINLLKLETPSVYYGSMDGVTISIDDDGVITSSGTATAESAIRLGYCPRTLKSGRTYVFRVTDKSGDSTGISVFFRTSTETFAVTMGTPLTRTFVTDTAISQVEQYYSNGRVFNGKFTIEVLEAEDEAQSYQPYSGEIIHDEDLQSVFTTNNLYSGNPNAGDVITLSSSLSNYRAILVEIINQYYNHLCTVIPLSRFDDLTETGYAPWYCGTNVDYISGFYVSATSIKVKSKTSSLLGLQIYGVK